MMASQYVAKMVQLTTIFVTFMFGMFSITKANVRNVKFSLVNGDNYIQTKSDNLTVRGSLDCSQICTTDNECCGFIFARATKVCRLISVNDIRATPGSSSNGIVNVYLDSKCATVLQNIQQNPTSTVSSSSISTPVIGQQTTTVQSSSTHTSTTQLYTIQPSTARPSTIPPSTTHPTTTQLSTTQISTSILAIVCLTSDIIAFSHNSVFYYKNYMDLLTGPWTTSQYKDTFSQTQGNDITAAYSSNSDTINLVTGSSVHRYVTTNYARIAESSHEDNFGDDIDFQMDAILSRDNGDLYCFSGGDIHIISSNGKTTTVSWDNNGSKNPYKSKNHKDRPTQTTASCEIDSDTDLFISGGDVYIFTYSQKLWQNLGQIVCQ